MTVATISKINTAIAQYGVGVHKGNGYFYFYDIGEEYIADHVASIYSCHLRCMSLEQWVAHVEAAVKGIEQ